MRQETTSNITLPHCCNGCGAVSKTPQHVCSECFVVHYCDKKCQKVHWKRHNALFRQSNTFLTRRIRIVRTNVCLKGMWIRKPNSVQSR